MISGIVKQQSGIDAAVRTRLKIDIDNLLERVAEAEGHIGGRRDRGQVDVENAGRKVWG
ncbi:MAG TPA: hypothetical protein VMG10_15680 [Gemmataceae bacterium]|nr:hypothetical protein [Gemmataceae bacterium]